jgi:hypothetical protein
MNHSDINVGGPLTESYHVARRHRLRRRGLYAKGGEEVSSVALGMQLYLLQFVHSQGVQFLE